ncbi:MAG: serine--tRNA ligase [Patescibacteria group bacterium]
MLDIHFIRENKDIVQDGARKKHVNINIDELLVVDDERRELMTKVEALRAEQNKVSDAITSASQEERTAMISEMRRVKDELGSLEEKLKEVMQMWKTLMLQVPNTPDISVPEGETDADNQHIKSWGEKPAFSFEAKDHVEIMRELGMVDFERGSKVHGFRGYYLTNDGARLCFAIWNYGMDFFTKKDLMPMIPPVIVKKQLLYGTGHLPNDVEDIYATQDEDYLAGTAEIPVMGYYGDEVLAKEELPKKILGFSPCYRREAGSYSKDVKGLIRVHEFFKLEQVILCEANHEESVKWHEWLNRNTEEFIETLGIPYRTVANCGADLGLGQVKKYDIELWVPLEEKYREISSASYFHDFQCRRFNIKYTDKDGARQFAHSLNCTAIPTPRILVSLVENFQQADGSVLIPEVLRPYMGGRDRLTRKATTEGITKAQ